MLSVAFNNHDSTHIFPPRKVPPLPPPPRGASPHFGPADGRKKFESVIFFNFKFGLLFTFELFFASQGPEKKGSHPRACPTTDPGWVGVGSGDYLSGVDTSPSHPLYAEQGSNAEWPIPSGGPARVGTVLQQMPHTVGRAAIRGAGTLLNEPRPPRWGGGG